MNQPSQPLPAKGAKRKSFLLIVGGGFLAFVLVVGMVASIAIPSCVEYQCRSKQSEAKANLRKARVALEAFLAKYDRYPKRFEESEWKPGSETQRYRYQLQSMADRGSLWDVKRTLKRRYFIDARAVDAALKDDHWRIDRSGELEHVVDGCRRP